MERVVSDDPAPLRELSRETPGDLAAVVMRCLSKDPNQRYPSAAAVAADLRAFLEGYPVSAVRPTLRYVALKTVTRRPLLTAVLAIVVLAAAAFGGLWVHTRWSAVRQAVVAAKMGHRVAEAKSLLWRARTAPLHDIRPHLAEVRRQMDVIRTEMATAGRTARGTGHLALGEAHLALRELEHAEHHLRTAWSSGYQTPEGAFAMARAVAGQYRDGLSSVEHIRDARLRELRLEEIRSTLGVELVAWWQRTEDRASTPSELLAALVASHEGRIDDALAACSKVLDAAPWMYEAHLIAGDLHLLRAAEEQPLSERWFALIDHARSAFRAAVTLAPSDPSCRIGAARAELFVFERCTAPGQEERILAAVEAGLRATRNALLCNPSQADGWTVRSRLMQAKASLLQRLDEPWHHVIEDAIELAEAAIQLQPAAPSTHQCLGDAWVMKARLGALRGEDVEDDLKEAIASLEKVVGLSPSHTAYHALGIAWRRLASCRIGRGRDGADDALARAAVSFGEALQYRPDNHHTLHNLGRTAHIRGQLAARQGRDPMEHYQRAEANLQRAIATEPTLGIPYNSLGNLQTDIAKWQARCGHDASEALKGAIAAFEQAMLNAPEYAFAANNLADALIFNASLEIDRGRDPSGLLQRADELLDTALTWRPGYATPLFNRGVLERTRARYERLTGGDPLPALGAAAVGLAGGLERRHDVAEAEAMLADIHLERARVLDARKRDVTNAMRLHRRWAETALEHDPLLAAGWRTLLAGALCRAERALDHGPDAQEAIAEAESALREARSIDPSHPALLRSSARLRWLMARSAEEPARRSRLLADGLEQLAPLVDRDTPDPRALLLAARLHRAHPDSREHAEASALIQRALAINPLLATDASTVHD
jgi:serine/threonine-protein kinase